MTSDGLEDQVWPELIVGEALLTDEEEMFLRQVKIDHCDDSEVGHLAFQLSSGDDGKLSGARSSVQSAEGAFLQHQNRGKPTAGTWGITVAELDSLRLRCVDDSGTSDDLPTGHVFMDMRLMLGKSQVRKQQRQACREALADLATDRGRLYPPNV